MVLSTLNPILARHLSHVSHRLDLKPTRPTPLSVALHPPRFSNSAWRQQGPIRVVASTPRARVRVVPIRPLSVWPAAQSPHQDHGA